jgi:hypothetical protein
MAHLLPWPLPPNEWVPSFTNFSIGTVDGTTMVGAWIQRPPPFDDSHYCVGIEGSDRVDSTMYTVPGKPDCVAFKLRGCRGGDNIALYINADHGSTPPKAPRWVRFSEFVTVNSVTADSWQAKAASGTLPTATQNSKIKFYPFGSMQHNPPIPEADWMSEVQKTLDQICKNSVGEAVVKGVVNDTIIYPYIKSDKQAWSDVRFTPQNFYGSIAPGSSADEILLHELVHVVENNSDGYNDGSGFKFDEADFLTINLTNVYACLLGRGLRKDHAGYNFLPQEYFDNPKKHYDTFKDNYKKAERNVPAIIAKVKAGSNLWNPFKFL